MLPSLIAPIFEKCLKNPADKLFNRIGSRDKGTVRFFGKEVSIATALLIFGIYLIIYTLCNEIFFWIDFIPSKKDPVSVVYLYYNLVMHYLNAITTFGGAAILISNYCRDKMFLQNLLMWLSLGVFTVTAIDILTLPFKTIVGLVQGDTERKMDFRFWLDKAEIIQNCYTLANMVLYICFGKAWIDAMLSGQAIKVAGGSIFEKKDWLQIRFEKECAAGKIKMNKQISKAMTLHSDSLSKTVKKKKNPNIKSKISAKHGIDFTSSEDDLKAVNIPHMKQTPRSDPDASIISRSAMQNPRGKSCVENQTSEDDYYTYVDDIDEDKEEDKEEKKVPKDRKKFTLRKTVTFRSSIHGGLESEHEFSRHTDDMYTETQCTESFLSWSDD